MCKGQIASFKNNHALVEQSFHSAFSGDKGLRHCTLQRRDSVYQKSLLKKNSLQFHWRGPPSGTADQPSYCQIPTDIPLDSHDTQRKHKILTRHAHHLVTYK